VSRRFPVKRTIAFLSFVTLLVAPSVCWRITPLRDVNVVIVDKTLPQPAWREHERVTWWLTHRRVRSPLGDARWLPERDYIGYNPTAKVGTDLDSAALARTDLVYIADSYGVYTGDYLADDDSTTHGELNPSTRIYGGVTVDEVSALEKYVARGGSVIAEFNTLEEPTSLTDASDRLGALLGVKFQRWLGRWYGNLASEDEIPEWMRARYERAYWRPWEFRGPGIVVFAEGSDRIVVIDSTEFTSTWPLTIEVDNGDDPLMRSVRTGQPYWYWFSGVSPTSDGRVLASYHLSVSPGAKSRLRAMGFPSTFPAVVRHSGSGMRAYFAGDFADVGVAPPPMMRTRGLDWFGRWQSREKKAGSQRRFFWRVTIPLWDGMLRETIRTRTAPDSTGGS
jgi:hypothetical protein